MCAASPAHWAATHPVLPWMCQLCNDNHCACISYGQRRRSDEVIWDIDLINCEVHVVEVRPIEVHMKPRVSATFAGINIEHLPKATRCESTEALLTDRYPRLAPLCRVRTRETLRRWRL